LEYGFNDLKLNEIVSFAVEDNLPSIAVMERLGMTPDPARNYDHPGVPDSHLHLKPHRFYAITKEQWSNQQKKKATRKPPLIALIDDKLFFDTYNNETYIAVF